MSRSRIDKDRFGSGLPILTPPAPSAAPVDAKLYLFNGRENGWRYTHDPHQPSGLDVFLVILVFPVAVRLDRRGARRGAREGAAVLRIVDPGGQSLVSAEDPLEFASTASRASQACFSAIRCATTLRLST
jgi:hypothetical protein